MVFDHAHKRPSQWATMRSVAEKLGRTVEALRRWVRQAERDGGKRPGLTTDERQRLKDLGLIARAAAPSVHTRSSDRRAS